MTKMSKLGSILGIRRPVTHFEHKLNGNITLTQGEIRDE